ncbi:hypothetical protein HPP92_000782 [Vanilla planifolia]|uniref:Lysine ketoglutarate reductase trans-splicing-like protein n=1 Tax=Vanilla planifolia TaxID=51239 RepID=A0A835VKS8_VANPL|nr:hypothetical protein HPP92_000782 [Vanilla planifolia]
MKLHLHIVLLVAFILFVYFRMTKFQYQQTEMENETHHFASEMESEESYKTTTRIGYLPHGIVQQNSDLELKPLWVSGSSQIVEQNNRKLLAISVGIKQKRNVDTIVNKFLPENFTVILFHYDGNVNGWHDLLWSNEAIHVAAHNQTKWWFAKRFLHPDVVSIYEYLFLWDEDIGVENFHPGRYLDIVNSEGLEISQPALEPHTSEVHHQITVRRKKGMVHSRRVWDPHNLKCSDDNDEPPCAGWVEGMAPVFSRSAWRCAWYLIQNDLIHGWGLDMKLGYCAQGDRTKKVGVVDTEFIVHQGVQTLGGPSSKRKRRGTPVVDSRAEVRRRARYELQTFEDRWLGAIKEDKEWVDPFRSLNHRDVGS